MEYVIVLFKDDRGLVIDGDTQGRTNQVLELERGTHTITIKAPPSDFRPEEKVTIILKGTTAISPKEVRYEKVEP